MYVYVYKMRHFLLDYFISNKYRLFQYLPHVHTSSTKENLDKNRTINNYNK